ncbi:MAG: L,D-transpeptidase family protein [Flavobacteriales bacterium]|nr:L,D-transpeptidase family protein [Flavobacteriales bacterium]
MTFRWAIVAWVGLPVWAACTDPPRRSDRGPVVQERSVPMAEDVPLNALLDSLGIDADEVAIHVDKSERRLCLKHADATVRCYDVVLGGSPEGDKRMQGDQRTPEGSFTFRDKYPHREWHRFAWIDYPNAESVRRFKARRAAGEIPADARIGGEVGIHGVPAGMDLLISTGVDWTLGCIAMRNDDLDEVYDIIRPGRTIVHIGP